MLWNFWEVTNCLAGLLDFGTIKAKEWGLSGGQAVEICLAGSHFRKSEDCHQQYRHARRGGIVGCRDQQPGTDRLGLGCWGRFLFLTLPRYKVTLTRLKNALETVLVIQAGHSLSVGKYHTVYALLLQPAMMLFMLPFLLLGLQHLCEGLDSVLLQPHIVRTGHGDLPIPPVTYLLLSWFLEQVFSRSGCCVLRDSFT